ncbi:MAG TPA: GNAT family N-acetyltransferase [Bacteroidales bacterium]|nr:GNAT family N-acetyltransferase [Bacteroidales bacterium]
MEKIIVSEAGDEDRDWTARLIASSEPWISLGITLENSMKFCHDKEYMVFIARLAGEPCGAMVIHPRGMASSPYLKSIVVESRFRSKGVGSALLEHAEGYFRESFRHFFMCVSSFNPRAKALYEKLGYKQVGELKDYILEGESELIMHKRIR